MALQQTSLVLEKEDLLEGVKDMKDAGSGNGAREGKLDVGEMRRRTIECKGSRATNNLKFQQIQTFPPYVPHHPVALANLNGTCSEVHLD
jgi:hypothetical protein